MSRGVVRESSHCEPGALARQVGEEVGGGRQTGWGHVPVGRARQLVKTPDRLQTAPSIRAGEEADQQMHTVLQPVRKQSMADNTSMLCTELTQPSYLMKASCADGSRRALLRTFMWASLSGPLWNKSTTACEMRGQFQMSRLLKHTLCGTTSASPVPLRPCPW